MSIGEAAQCVDLAAGLGNQNLGKKRRKGGTEEICEMLPLLQITWDGVWGAQAVPPLFWHSSSGPRGRGSRPPGPLPPSPPSATSPSALARLQLPLRRINF